MGRTQTRQEKINFKNQKRKKNAKRPDLVPDFWEPARQ